MAADTTLSPTGEVIVAAFKAWAAGLLLVAILILPSVVAFRAFTDSEAYPRAFFEAAGAFAGMWPASFVATFTFGLIGSAPVFAAGFALALWRADRWRMRPWRVVFFFAVLVWVVTALVVVGTDTRLSLAQVPFVFKVLSALQSAVPVFFALPSAFGVWVFFRVLP